MVHPCYDGGTRVTIDMPESFVAGEIGGQKETEKIPISN